MVQLSHSYMTTGKTIILTICTLVGKVMSLFFKTLSRSDIDIPPRSKHLCVCVCVCVCVWLQSPSALILKFKKMKSDTVSTFFSSVCHKVIGPWGDRLGHRLGLLWCSVLCLGNELRPFCYLWDHTQVLHFGLLLTMRATPFLLTFFPIVVKLTVILIKLAHSHPF